MTGQAGVGRRRIDSSEWRTLAGWLALAAAGLMLTLWAVRSGARLGTASAPFLGRYRLQLSPLTLLAPAVAAGVLLLAQRGWFDRARFGLVLGAGYLGGLVWALSLALAGGLAGLTLPLLDSDNYQADVAGIRDDPLGYLRTFTEPTTAHTPAARGHPPGPVLALWALHRIGVTDQLALAVLVTAVGVATIPLVLVAVRGVCGPVPARRYAPVLILAPYAIWIAVSTDIFVTVLGAGMVAAGVWASAARCRGPRAGAWSALAGVLLGTAALFSYAAGWLGLSLVCLYFARRRPFLNVATGLGALLPVVVADRLGFGYVNGLLLARNDFATRVEPYRSVWWWSLISLVALLLAAGPPLVLSLRRVRTTPGWPFLVGAGCAVLFSILAGIARGGVEHAWLAFFPWLTVAAVAPHQQGGPPVPAPLLLTAVGAVSAVVIEAVLATPW